MTTIFEVTNSENQLGTILTDDKIKSTIQNWMTIINDSKLKAPKDTEELLIYLLINVDKQGVLLETIKDMSKKSGIKENNIQKILVNLELVKLIYRRYGIVGFNNANYALGKDHFIT